MSADLSLRHEPVSDFLRASDPAADRDRYRLTDDQVAFFHEFGYLKGVRILTDEQVDALRDQLTGLLDPHQPGNELFHEYHSNESADPSRVLFHALGAWRIAPGFHDILWHPAFTTPASQLLAGPVRFWHDQLFCKPARHGGVVAWHQDYSYWTRTQPMEHLTCWIGLDDATKANGCLHYIPSSHRWHLLPVTGLAGDMDAIQTVLSPEQKAQFKTSRGRTQKGRSHVPPPPDGPRLLRQLDGTAASSHRPQRLPRRRPLQHRRPPAQGVPVVPRGAKMEGQFFPLLFEPSQPR